MPNLESLTDHACTCILFSRYVPDLVLDGTLVKVVEPMFREKIFEGYTFVLGSLNLVDFLFHFPSVISSQEIWC